MGRLAIAMLFLLLARGSGMAHGLLATVNVQADRVLVTAFFDDDTPASKAKVQLFGSGEVPLAEARTNDTGVAELQIQLPAGEYRVVVNAGAGHRTEKRFQVRAGSPLPTRGGPRASLPQPAGTDSIRSAPLTSDRVGSPLAPLPSPGGARPSFPQGGEGMGRSEPSGEPSRAELTQTPWLKIAIGLGAIALFALLLWLLPKRRG